MKTWNTIDKSEWSEGEWKAEPDKAQWIDDKTGLDCLIIRGPSGALCGYVGVPESNQFFDIDYDSVRGDTFEDGYPDVHGGLTFSDRCRPSDDESRGICHAGNIANKMVWWLGFDCAHSGDLCPKYDSEYSDHYTGESYRNLNYVKRQVEGLATQVA